MNNHKGFIMKVLEVLNSSVDIKTYRNSGDIVNAIFEVDSKVYRFIASLINGRMGVSFSLLDDEEGPIHTTTGTGNQYQVMSTVVELTKRAISELKPNTIEFSTEDQSEGRKKLYARISNIIGKEMGYDLNTTPTPGSDIFIMTKRKSK